ncbi:response regulator [Nitrososphaera sp.]|uniref:response regulator n=1 Tax=Nitrososphaera sp. TaxID=1971748 RepID=UPI00317A136B
MAKILAIDDSEYNTQLIKDILATRNHAVETASSGAEGLEKYAAFQPDVVLLDLAMPGMDGREVLERLMKVDDNACVVMVSAVGNRQILESCIQKGAIGYVEKPFSVRHLASVVASVIAGKAYPKIFALLSLVTSRTEKKVQDVLGSAATLRLAGMSIAGAQSPDLEFRSRFADRSSMHMQQGTAIFFNKFSDDRTGVIASLVRDEDMDVILGDALYEKSPGRYRVGSDFFSLINSRFLSEISEHKRVDLRPDRAEFHVVSQGDRFWESLVAEYPRSCVATLEMFYYGKAVEFEVHVSSDSDLF